jgi:SnoaL-like domain
MTTATTFDFAGYRQALAGLDRDALERLLAPDAEYVQVDKLTPPSSPRVVRGRDAIAEMLDDIAGRGLTIEVSDPVVGEARAAYSCECRYPDGTRVASVANMELREGRIARIFEVQAWDEASEA